MSKSNNSRKRGVKSRGMTKGRVSLPVDLSTLKAVRDIVKTAEVKAQHGPVRRFTKDQIAAMNRKPRP